MSTSLSLKDEEKIRVSSLQHPSGNDQWPCLYEEVRDMLDMSIFCYWAGDIRKMIKNETLTDEAIVNALFRLPSSHVELAEAVKKNHDYLSNRKSDPSFALYYTALGEVVNRFQDQSVRTPNTDFFQLLRFEDEHEGVFGGPVFAVTINHVQKRVVVGFRGSVTTKDFLCDWKTSLASIPNPLVDEKKCGYQFLKIHHGFKEYLYDAAQEVESSDGALEKKPLITSMVSAIAKLFEDFPNYYLYTTGHSLGGALATLFAMEAGASKDPRIRKPVTCITIASPRVGNLSFARVFKQLEKSRRVRCFRVLNSDDLIPEIPATANVNCLYIPCCRNKTYRHVGVKCELQRGKNPVISIPRHYNHPFRLFFSDMGQLMEQFFSIGWWAPLACACQTSFASNHSCKEYFERLRHAEPQLSAMHLSDVYDKHKKHMVMLHLVEDSARKVLLR